MSRVLSVAVDVGAALFWMLVVLSPILAAMTIGQGGPTNLVVVLARAVAAGPQLAIYMAGAPETIARPAGVAVAVVLAACAVARIVRVFRRKAAD